jgi:hypothetical protein
MIAHGFAVEFLAELLRDGLVNDTFDLVPIGEQKMQVRLKITDKVSAITQFDGAVCGAFEGQACGTAVPIWPDFPIPVSGRCRDAGKRNWEVGAWAPVSW